MIRIVSVNVNGIRSAAKKGLFSWLTSVEADIVCLQEVRAYPDQFPEEESQFVEKFNYFRYLRNALKPGYSGVATYSRVEARALDEIELDSPLKDEGRVLISDFGALRVANLYFPSGTSGLERQAEKYRFMDRIERSLQHDLQKVRPTVYVGDWNIAHTKDDIKNWRSNQNNSGFLPEERAWMDKVTADYGFVDAFRLKVKGIDEYSWWSNRGRARENNVGWRIDYQIVHPMLAPRVKDAFIYRDSFFSDHAPVVVDYDLEPVNSNRPSS